METGLTEDTTRWRVEAFLLPGAAFVALCMMAWVLLALGTLIPLDLASLDERQDAIEDRTERRPAAGGCGLNQRATSSGCQDLKAQNIRQAEMSIPSSLEGRGLEALQGTLTLPRGVAPPYAGVVLIGGSGPTDRDGTSRGDLVVSFDEPFHVLEALAEALTGQGLAVLRYDKRTCLECYGDAAMNPDKFEFMDLVADGRDAVAALAAHPAVNSDAVVVIGHSQGGLLAPLVANDNPHVVGVVTLAGTTQSLGQVMAEQAERLAEARQRRWDLQGHWSQRAVAEAVRACLERLDDPGANDDHACVTSTLSQRLLRQDRALAQEARTAMKTLEIPLMAVQGGLDLNVAPDQASRSKALRQGKDGEYHHLPGLTHALVRARPEVASPPRLDSRVTALLKAFVSSLRPTTVKQGAP